MHNGAGGSNDLDGTEVADIGLDGQRPPPTPPIHCACSVGSRTLVGGAPPPKYRRDGAPTYPYPVYRVYTRLPNL